MNKPWEFICGLILFILSTLLANRAFFFYLQLLSILFVSKERSKMFFFLSLLCLLDRWASKLLVWFPEETKLIRASFG